MAVVLWDEHSGAGTVAELAVPAAVAAADTEADQEAECEQYDRTGDGQHDRRRAFGRIDPGLAVAGDEGVGDRRVLLDRRFGRGQLGRGWLGRG
jgi:hypothetical protein